MNIKSKLGLAALAVVTLGTILPAPLAVYANEVTPEPAPRVIENVIHENDNPLARSGMSGVMSWFRSGNSFIVDTRATSANTQSRALSNGIAGPWRATGQISRASSAFRAAGNSATMQLRR